MPLSIQDLLQRSRRELLDLSTRNRLLSIPIHTASARVIHLREESSAQLHRLLIEEGKTFNFLPAQGREESPVPGTDPGAAEEARNPPPSKRQADTKLQTDLSPEGLQRRLLDLYRDAQTMVEEQGVNILFLALGQLKWFETDDAQTARYAPLILIPVQLLRKNAADRFQLQGREEEVQENLSLQAKLLADFGLQLPQFGSEEELHPGTYFDRVASAVASQSEWQVLPNAICLGFFSFAKFLLYRDLDPANWPDPDLLLKNSFITSLLQDGFAVPEAMIAEETHLDGVISADRLDLVMDADSSQTAAIEMVRQGCSLVIQGPPGTGKSQSISNLIASAVLDGKKVLFVAEKLAALEVVKRRLERVGLGPVCLELHSNKANKKAVLDEIGRTWKLGRAKESPLENLVPKLEQSRSGLNRHAHDLHAPFPPSNLSAYHLVGRLLLLENRGRDLPQVASFPGLELWTADAIIERRALLAELCGRVEEIGCLAQHPWRGICRPTVLKVDLDPLATLMHAAASAIPPLLSMAGALAQTLCLPAPETVAGIGRLQVMGEQIALAPPLDRQAIRSQAWSAGQGALRELLAQGQKFSALKESVPVMASVWEQDFSQVRREIAVHGQSMLRLLNGPYRRAMAELRSVLTAPLPATQADRLQLLEQIMAGQQSLRTLRSAEALGRSAFGAVWLQENTPWAQVSAILDWIAAQEALETGGIDMRELLARVQDQAQAGSLARDLAALLQTAQTAMDRMAQELTLDPQPAFGVPSIDQIPLSALAERCHLWLAHMEGLVPWNNYYVRATRGRALGLSGILDRLENGSLPTSAVVPCFDRICYSQLLRLIVTAKPHLGQFDGVLQNQQVDEFRELDRDRLTLTMHRVLAAHSSRMPSLHAGVGATGLVLSELERKRGHRSVRRLLKDAGSVVQAIKPVFMMSPLSVAQFLEPGALEFDLLVMDEASQVQPVDALGAISRCRQMVVVGDSRQLPPTQFFTRLTTETEERFGEEESALVEATDMESILGLCCARGMPQAMLRWHYRSRHDSLIAVSNREFYENRLFIVPSPHRDVSELGLKFHYLPDGTFDSGGTGTNVIEAQVICRAILEHARCHPRQTLGVAAFSVRQQQAILDELEYLRRKHPETEPFFNSHPNEPFFVKNLENVQGDERDVIFISVGYGRNPQGYMAMRFGPLSMEGGERRLNVLISRAKLRCEVFASITSDDIDLQRASGRGVRAFKTFLNFAQTGRLAQATGSQGGEQSPFEEAVRRVLESHGHTVHPQVGMAGFFIDLAIVDPEKPGRYFLGIECDGASYHSSRSARDRDRLRQAVLEDHGWNIHRIWSTDWFQKPEDQWRRLAAAIDRARSSSSQASPLLSPDRTPDHLPLSASQEVAVEREEPLEPTEESADPLATPYVEARVVVPREQAPQDLPTAELARVLLEVIDQEGPIHESELINRVRDLWQLTRIGSRLQEAVGTALEWLLVSQRCEALNECWMIPGKPVPVRHRGGVTSAGLRKPDLVPPVEIRAAILLLIQEHHGMRRTELAPAVARRLGFKITTAPLRESVTRQTEQLLVQEELEEARGLLRCPSPSKG